MSDNNGEHSHELLWWGQIKRGKSKLIEYDFGGETKRVPDGVWMTGAPQFWAHGEMGEGVIVGVIDTGIDSSHEALQGKKIKQTDYTNDKGARPSEYNPHGTHVAGTIGGNHSNLVGVAPAVEFRDYRVFDSDGKAADVELADVIDAAVEDKCDVINLSLKWGIEDKDGKMQAACQRAKDKGVAVICAAGNDNQKDWHKDWKNPLPASLQETVSVAAVDIKLSDSSVTHADFSNENQKVDVAADGYYLYSSISGGGYDEYSGTSMATPCVAGMAALLVGRLHDIEKKRGIKNTPNWHQLLLLHSVPVKGEWTEKFGFGVCSFFSEIPELKKDQWVLASLSQSSGAPKAPIL